MVKKRFKIVKLVRDNSGRVLEQKGTKVLERFITDDNEYISLLKQKLVEKVSELLEQVVMESYAKN